MKRDPIEKEKTDYLKSIQIKKIHPRFFYHRCNKCGYEYKNEMMYECSTSDPPFTWTLYHTGCSHCFGTIEDFRKWLEDRKYIRTYDNYKTLLQRMCGDK